MPHKNIEDRRACLRDWRKANPDYSKKWRKNHLGYMSNWFKNHPGYIKEHLKKFLANHPEYKKINYTKKKMTGGEQARWAVRGAIRKGELLSLSKNFVICADCNNRAIGYDHRDYNKPLKVEPVCRRCNNNRGKAIPLIKGRARCISVRCRIAGIA